MANSNMLLAIFIGIALIAVIYYLNQNDEQPIQNHGSIGNQVDDQSVQQTKATRPNMGDSIVDDLVAQYNQRDTNDYVSGTDPMSSEYGPFDNYGTKKQIQLRNSEFPYEDDDEHDPRDFAYKKQKFSRRTPEDIKDLFDVNKMLPQEIEDDWFDTVLTPI